LHRRNADVEHDTVDALVPVLARDIVEIRKVTRVKDQAPAGLLGERTSKNSARRSTT